MYLYCQKRCHATLNVRPLLLINDNAFVIRDVYDLNAQIPFVSGFIVLNYLYWYRINISTTFNVAFTQYNRYIMYEYAYVQREYMVRGIIFIISSSHYTYTTGRGLPHSIQLRGLVLIHLAGGLVIAVLVSSSHMDAGANPLV